MTSKRPDWVSAVGIIAIIFAVFGLLDGLQSMAMPRMLSFQSVLFEEMEDIGKNMRAELEESTDTGELPPQLFLSLFGGLFDNLHRFLNPPGWYRSWLVFGGLLKTIASAFYLYAALLLLNLTRVSIPVFCCAASARILMGILERVLALRVMAIPGVFFVFAGFAAIGVVVDIVLLIVVLASDKSDFISRSAPASRDGSHTPL
jgi:hypothetical protein